MLTARDDTTRPRRDQSTISVRLCSVGRLRLREPIIELAPELLFTAGSAGLRLHDFHRLGVDRRVPGDRSAVIERAKVLVGRIEPVCVRRLEVLDPVVEVLLRCRAVGRSFGEAREPNDLLLFELVLQRRDHLRFGLAGRAPRARRHEANDLELATLGVEVLGERDRLEAARDVRIGVTEELEVRDAVALACAEARGRANVVRRVLDPVRVHVRRGVGGADALTLEALVLLGGGGARGKNDKDGKSEEPNHLHEHTSVAVITRGSQSIAAEDISPRRGGRAGYLCTASRQAATTYVFVFYAPPRQTGPPSATVSETSRR